MSTLTWIIWAIKIRKTREPHTEKKRNTYIYVIWKSEAMAWKKVDSTSKFSRGVGFQSTNPIWCPSWVSSTPFVNQFHSRMTIFSWDILKFSCSIHFTNILECFSKMSYIKEKCIFCPYLFWGTAKWYLKLFFELPFELVAS